MLEHIDRMTKPIVAAVNGLAPGGVAELASRCPDMVRPPRASFHFPEVKLGKLPRIGGMIVAYGKWREAAGIPTPMLTRAKPLSTEAVTTIMEAVEQGLRARIFVDVLKMGYQAFGDVGAIPAAAEVVTALVEDRIPTSAGRKTSRSEAERLE